MPEKSINTYIYIIYKKFGKESLQKKSVTFFRLEGGGQDRPVFVTLFFQKHGLKWLNIAF